MFYEQKYFSIRKFFEKKGLLEKIISPIPFYLFLKKNISVKNFIQNTQRTALIFKKY